MHVRRATHGDLDTLVRLEENFPSDRLPRRSLHHLITRAHADAWVAESGGEVVGDAIVLYRRGFDAARLYSLVVAPQARRRGVADALLEVTEAAALERGCVAVRLEVREDALPAQRLYQRRGYRAFGRSGAYYLDGTDAIRMSKRLRGGAPALLGVPFIPQSLPFSCGPACLMMATRAFGGAVPPSRAEELALWREATTVYLAAGHGGCSPHGLAVAAARRGFDVEVYDRDGAVPFLDSVRAEAKKEVVRLAHDEFLAELRELGVRVVVAPFGIETVDAAVQRGRVAILLVSGYRLYAQKTPHWVVVTGSDADHLYVHDPFVPDGSERADGVHLPLPRNAFESVASFGKARHRYLVSIGPPSAGSRAR